MKTLYKVIVSAPVYVYAENSDEAEDFAKKAIIEEKEYNWLDYDVYKATLEDIPKGFEEYRPWGHNFEYGEPDSNITEIVTYTDKTKC